MQSIVTVCPYDSVNGRWGCLSLHIVSYCRRFGRKIDVPVINRVHKVTLHLHCCHRWGLYALIVPKLKLIEERQLQRLCGKASRQKYFFFLIHDNDVSNLEKKMPARMGGGGVVRGSMHSI